jgi:hypothetical protein
MTSMKSPLALQPRHEVRVSTWLGETGGLLRRALFRRLKFNFYLMSRGGCWPMQLCV